MWQGITYPTRAARLLNQTPSLWPYLWMPSLITLGLGLLIYTSIFLPLWRSLQQWGDRLGLTLGSTIEQWPTWLQFLNQVVQTIVLITQGFLGLIALVCLGWLITQLSLLLAAPWYGPFTETIEKHHLGQIAIGQPSQGIGEDISRALQFELKKVLLGLGISSLLIAMQGLPILGQVVGTLGSLGLGATLACLDFWDSLLERQRLQFRQKLAWVWRQWPNSWSFGLTCNFLVSLPLLNLLTIPLCVAAGTLFVCDRIYPTLLAPPKS